MSTDRDTTRIVRSWLEEGVTALPDRVLDTVLDQLPATPQRRSWWPTRRISYMNSIAKGAIAAAAVVVVAVIGVRLIPGIGPAGQPTLPPSLAPTASPTPPQFPPTGALSAGRHSMTLAGKTFTFELTTPDWTSNGAWGIDKGGAGVKPDGAGFIFWDDDANGVFSDPCAFVKAPVVGPSAVALAAAIAGIPGIEVVSGPDAVTVGGKPAEKVVIKIPDSIACSPETFFLWYDASNPENKRYATQAGQTIRVWIIEVDGVRIQIDGETFVGAGAQPGNEIQGIIDSIQFE